MRVRPLAPADPQRRHAQRSARAAVAALALLAAPMGGCDTLDESGDDQLAIGASLVSVTDGDTLVVRTRARERERVRLLGVDTPEVYGRAECGGREATTALEGLVRPGQRVRLATDPTQDRRDRYGRLLAYVETVGGRQLNEAQVRAGWARVYVYDDTPFSQVKRFRRAERTAREQRLGVWRLCGRFES